LNQKAGSYKEEFKNPISSNASGLNVGKMPSAINNDYKEAKIIQMGYGGSNNIFSNNSGAGSGAPNFLGSEIGGLQ